MTEYKVGIVGCGLVGRQWAIMFSTFNYKVVLYDANEAALEQAPELIRNDLVELIAGGLARGDATLETRMARIHVASSLEECVKNTVHIQESIFENLELKQNLFEQIDKFIEPENTTVSICTSTSFMLPSKVFANVKTHKDQCLVAHPINPAMLVRLVELVPCNETRQDIVIRTRITMTEIGQKPVELRRELPGFALNRLQGAVFQAAFRLVHDGIISADDIDTVVSDGLGPRYAFIGPWMVGHLNANGLADYLSRYADGFYSTSLDPPMRLEGEAAQQLVDSMNHQVPVNELNQKRAWRDKCLMELSKIKTRLEPQQ